jgi:MoaA/NifB/PqqE/SkfB family radical SAM enzyme
MCDIWKDKRRQEISTAEVREWASEWKELGVHRIVLSGGEALMHSDLWSLCEPLTEAGISLTLLSTGLLLSRDAERIAHVMGDVIVSLDGPRHVHDAIRSIPRAYDRLAEGVAAVRAIRPDFPISARCTVQRQNFRCLSGTVSAAHDLGLDRISFLAADVSTEAFNRPSGWDAPKVASIAVPREDLPELRRALETLERDFAADFGSGFIVESPDRLRKRLLEYFGALVGEGDFPKNVCNAPWVSSVIEADGTVRPCFFHAPLGNIRAAGSLSAVLDSPSARAFRRDLDVGTNPICKTCVCTLNLKTT